MTSSATTPASLKRTPLHDVHVALGAKMVPFAGYEMPVNYPTGIAAEHKAVREECGLFDVSHMGEFMVTGDDAVEFVNYVTTNNVAALEPGQIQYTGILNERGTFEDDCLVYRDEDSIMMVVNASNADKDFGHISAHLERFGCKLKDVSEDIALLALQGPKAASILGPLTEIDLAGMKYYHFARGKVAGIDRVWLSRTGYTGEDGFELYFAPEDAPKMWSALTSAGNVTPAGLGCRDTLRLEMGMALYGNDIDDMVTPYEAGLGWIVKLQKGDFVGRDALVKQKEEGVSRKLVGFTFDERAIPRHGYPVYYKGERVGSVCSGTMSPTLGTPMGTCYLPKEGTAEGTEFEVEIRGKRVKARVVKMPFYKKGSHL